MADYFPLLARAVSALPDKSGESRRLVYERARKALLTQLRSANPPLSDEDVNRESRSLEEAIRRLEAEYGGDAPPAELPSAAPPPVTPPPAAPPPAAAAPEPPVEAPPPTVAPPVAAAPREPAADTPSAPPLRRPIGPVPAAGSMDTPDPAGLVRPGPTPRGEVRPTPPRPPAGAPARPAAAPRAAKAASAPSAVGNWRRFLPLLVLIGVLAALGGAGYAAREPIVAFFRDLRSTAQPVATTPEANPAPAAAADAAKSTDRIAQAPADPARRVAPSAAPAAGTAVPAVAQRAVLFEENPSGGPQGLQQFVGTVVWKTETFSPGTGLPPDLGIRASVDIPDRKLKVDLSLRRNQEPNLPASHIIEVQFNIGPDFPLGGITNVPGMRAKASEAAQGVPLSGLAVRVAPGYFLIGLSALDIERQRNLALLFTQNWLDLPIVFGNGRRGILVLEKGLPGDQAFRAALTAWGVPLPPTPGPRPAAQP